MAGSLNKVILIGNLGRDPELKMTTTGKALAKFSLATTESWKTPSGERASKTEWHEVVVWGKQAETAERYLRKGKQVMVEGRIQYSDHTDQNGVKRKYTNIQCENFIMLGRADESSRQGGGSYGKPQATAGPQEFDEPEPPPPPGGYGDDDIPF